MSDDPSAHPYVDYDELERQTAAALLRAAIAEAGFDPPALVLSGLFRCECGKLHCRAGVNHGSECTCGQPLWGRAWG